MKEASALAREAIEDQIHAFMKSRPVCLLFSEHKAVCSANAGSYPAMMENQAYFEEKYPPYAFTWTTDDTLEDGVYQCNIID